MAINVLSPRVYNRISAGEVVERPASVVKELVENSLDANATKIKIEIDGGGIKKICVADNGCGIAKEDLPLVFLPHTTSKIKDVDDLNAIATLGFRGEALASIASVSMVTLTTKTKDSEMAYQIKAQGGEISKICEIARVDGTTLLVENLFYNTPARAKFLRKPKTEEAEVTHLVEKFMLARPDVNFEYVVDGKTIYNHTSGTLDEVMYLIYGKDVFDRLLNLKYEEDGVIVSGYIVSPKLSRPNRTYQSLFVNNRYVENYQISACVQGAYDSLLMKGRFPIYAIKLTLPYERVDVNVHPNKKEVKFDNNSHIFSIVRQAVEKALLGTNLIAEFEFTNQEEEKWSKFEIKNELHPQETSFNSYQKTKFDKLSPDEGATFISIDSESVNKEIIPKQKKDLQIVNMPEFSAIKSDKPKKNKRGGNIFFDDGGESLLREVELTVQNNQKEQKTTQIVEEKFLNVRSEEIKIIGVVFKTYIITEFEDSIYIVDQHAMHERQLYDKIKNQVETNTLAKQDLLLPYKFTLTAKDALLLESKLPNLQNLGFEILHDGQEFLITSIPFVLSGLNLENFVADILADESLNEKSKSDFINEKLCQTACKHAIRAGDSVNEDEILYLIDKMKDGVALCPHGRPIIVKFTRRELEKMFKRVL